MLQKEFFQVQPFNPYPYWGSVIVNLSGAQKFENNTVFIPGRYNIICRAGGAYIKDYEGTQVWSSGTPAQITKEISVRQKFIIRAYCGQKSFVLRDSSQTVSKQSGANPYSGEFKVNADTIGQDIPSVNHIFGNAGSCGRNYMNAVPYAVSGGNCLGNGAAGENNLQAASGAGSCLHFLPVGGVFGNDYLFAFHTTGGVTRNSSTYYHGGGGSAYGGAASGSGYSQLTSWNAGGTPYGTGGTATTSIDGIDGTGIGHGNANGTGAGAWFDGNAWHNSTELAADYDQDGIIKVEYLGPLN